MEVIKNLLFGKKRPPAQAEKKEGGSEIPNQTYDARNVLGGVAWYRERYNQAMKGVTFLGIALIISLGLNGILFFAQPKPKYFASSNDGKIIELIPLDRPSLTQAGLLNWTSEVITDLLSLNFLHWKGQLTESRKYFEAKAFKSVIKSMQANGIIASIEEKRLNVSATISKAPVIVASGVVQGRATWKIEVPIVVSYESSRGVEITQKLLATVLVHRTNTAVQPRGVEIKQLILARDTSA